MLVHQDLDAVGEQLPVELEGAPVLSAERSDPGDCATRNLIGIREKRVPLSSSAPPWVLLGVLAFPQGGAPPGKR
jgi:hypothetical protein